jgi:ArsR family transcriptional regulator, virulence genes transcriptional regulator
MRLLAMGNPKRLEILAILHEEEMSVCDLANRLGIGQSSLSQHLARLRQAGLVTTRRERQLIFYRAARPCLAELLTNLSRQFPASRSAPLIRR